MIENPTIVESDNRQEMEASLEIECCAICGKPLVPTQMVYRRRDCLYTHEQCQLDEISSECVECGEITEAERERKSTEEIF